MGHFLCHLPGHRCAVSKILQISLVDALLQADGLGYSLLQLSDLVLGVPDLQLHLLQLVRQHLLVQDLVPYSLQGIDPRGQFVLRLEQLLVLDADLLFDHLDIGLDGGVFLSHSVGDLPLPLVLLGEEGEVLLGGVLVPYRHLLRLYRVEVDAVLVLQLLHPGIYEIAHRLVVAGGEGFEHERVDVVLEDALLHHCLEIVGEGSQLGEPLENLQAAGPGVRCAYWLEQ